MEARSLGLRTDLFLLEQSGQVEDRQDYLVARTPSNPHYYFGNLLIFPGPPRRGDLARWTELFRREFRQEPRVRHVTFQWEPSPEDPGETEEFLAQGFRLEEALVLTARELPRPSCWNPELIVRPLTSDEDWAAWVESSMLCPYPGSTEAGYRVFKAAQMASYRRMTEAGLGFWLGGFMEGRLAGDLGLFVQDGLARYQAVQTIPSFRRRGICHTLVYEAARRARAELDARHLVIEVDSDLPARRIYESLGFRFQERSYSLSRPPGPEE